jgi:predicted transcriptional regulator
MSKKIVVFTGMNKTKRDRKIKRFREAHPDATQREIASYFGCTQQLISLILREVDNAP